MITAWFVVSPAFLVLGSFSNHQHASTGVDSRPKGK
jgi:hypothetical protein